MVGNDLESLRQINENIDAQLKEAEEPLSKKPSIFRTQERRLIVKCQEDSASESPDELPPTSTSIGTKATIRLQKAKIEALTNQIKVGVQANQDLQGQVEDLNARLAEATKNNNRSQSDSNANKSKGPRCTTLSSSTCNEVAKLRSELRSVKADLVSCQEALKGERRNGQVKLQKALREVNKYKRSAINSDKSGNSSIDPRDDSSSSSKRGPKFDTCAKERDALQQKAKQLERQRHDLMVALKHQQRLIQILQRQKILAFKEAFVKEIGWEKWPL